MKRATFFLIFASLLSFASAAPVRTPSFGPNGTHWPAQIPTPFLYTTASHDIEVSCSWAAISSALRSLDSSKVEAGVRILVSPGALPGNETGSVISNLGVATWNRRVLVCPRDGYGSVKVVGEAKILNVYNVCWAGFIFENALKFQGCKGGAVAWCKVGGWLGVYGNKGQTTDRVDIVEVVQPRHYVSNDDSADFYTAGGDFKQITFDGCYHAPRFYVYPYTGGKPHTDTVQFAGPQGGLYGNITLRDSAYFASNNCAIQTGNVDGLIVDHCYVVAGATSLSRYPHLDGGATEATTNAFNGSGKNLSASDSVFVGGMALNQKDATNPWVSVSNTVIDRSYISYLQPTSGAWTVNSSLNGSTAGMPAFPDDEYLINIWLTNFRNTPSKPTGLRIVP